MRPLPEGPLVSCLLLTRDRPGFAAVAAECFLRQDYPNRELLVLDDGRRPALDALPADPRIRYVRMDRPARTLGAKRNRAVELAAGPFLAHWDDDDWHAPWRLSDQVGGLLASGAELSGASRLLFLDPVAGRAWHYAHPGVGRPWLAGGTLCFTRDLWRSGRFAEVDTGEDGRFARTHRSRLVHRPGDVRMLVAMVHRRNASPKLTTDRGWEPWDACRLRALLGPALIERYAEAADSEPPEPAPLKASCIMPTRNRRRFVAQALRLFLAQDHPDKELIVVDDGSDPVRDLLPSDPALRYVRLAVPHSIGMKRNIACEVASGDVIVQWDDDDWHGRSRITNQLADIATGRGDVTGLEPSLYLDVRSGQFWSCQPELNQRMYVETVHGGTLAFRKQVWARCGGYPDESLAEDAVFLTRALQHGARLVRLLDPAAFIYVRHDANSWRFDCGTHDDPHAWRRVPAPPFLSAADLGFYRALREPAPPPLLASSMPAAGFEPATTTD